MNFYNIDPWNNPLEVNPPTESGFAKRDHWHEYKMDKGDREGA